MTTTQENDIQPNDLIHWLYEDALILQVREDNHCGGGEEDLSIDCDLNRIVQEQVRDYQTTDNLGRMIERELDNLATVIRQKLPEERIKEASWQLQAPGSYDPPHDLLSPNYRNAAALVAQPRRGAKTRERVDG